MTKRRRMLTAAGSAVRPVASVPRGLFAPTFTLLIVLASNATTALAQAPTTAMELMAVVKDVAQTSKQMDQLKEEKAEFEQTKVRDFLARRNRHDANPCTYPKGHHEMCANYDAEKESLDTEGRALEAEEKKYESQESLLKSHLQIQLAKIRLAPLLSGLEAWTRRVQGCSRLPPKSAAQCLDDAWEEHP
jgi:hypothetical protein